jgi:cytochrome c
MVLHRRLRTRLAAALPCALLAGLWCGLHSSAMAQSVARGQALFETRCVACHSLDANRVGPALRGVVGRAAGKAQGYFYSEAVAAATHVWDVPKLTAWLANPEIVLPGQDMNYRLDLTQDRDDVVAYLATLSSLPLSQPHPK